MKVLILNTFDIEGGAARAAYRLHLGLRDLKVDSKMLVQIKSGGDHHVISPGSLFGRGLALVRYVADGLPLMMYPKREQTNFFSAFIPERIAKKCFLINPDLIHMHWIGGGLVRIESFRNFKKPLVWTFHDMWAFTGGCSYDSECSRYEDSCGSCPKLNGRRKMDLSYRVLRRKKKAWENIPMTIVTPSRWLAECTRKSPIFRDHSIHVIPYGLDLTRYKPTEKKIAREILGLPQNKKLILYGTLQALNEKRTGFELFRSAMSKLSNSGWSDKAKVVIVGGVKPLSWQELGLKTHFMGRLNDDFSLALLYSASDVFVTSSIQDNYPNVLLESLACGTPCVGFDVGGIPEIIEHQKNGYVAKARDWEDLAYGIQWVLEDSNRSIQLGMEARKKAEQEYALEIQAKRYLKLYEEVLHA